LKNVLCNDLIKKINDICEKEYYTYLYWIPIEPEKTFDDENMECSINLSRIERFEIQIRTQNNIYEGTIYTCCKNIFRYINGNAGLVFMN